MPSNSMSFRLYQATHDAVKSLLSRRNPQIFCFSFHQRVFENGDFVPKPPIRDNIKSNASSNIRRTSEGCFNLQHTLDYLAALNGYEKVSKIKLRAALAEGVVAVQNGELLKHYSIYSRPCRSRLFTTKQVRESSSGFKIMLPADDNNVTSRFRHPPFCEEDFTLYRILENRLDTYLNNKKEAWSKYITKSGFTKVLRIMIGRKFMPPKSEEIADFRDLKSSQWTERSNGDSSQEGALLESEDLLIFYQGKVVVIEQVPPDFHLLALPPLWISAPRLPYKLKHNTASSIIYATLVIFGALPFAYRSVKYAIDYPAMVEILLASFFGTLAYSTWYSRYGARVRQQLSVERAVGSRVVARDDAVLALLVEGAVSNVTKLVLAEYAARLSQNERREFGIEDFSFQHGSDILKRLAGAGIDPVVIACDLGFLVKCKSEESTLRPRSLSNVLDVLDCYKT